MCHTKLLLYRCAKNSDAVVVGFQSPSIESSVCLPYQMNKSGPHDQNKILCQQIQHRFCTPVSSHVVILQ